jgi:glycerophosphoryl diester phosphodiesterase
MKKPLFFILLLMIVISCSNEIDIIFPTFKDGSILDGTLPIPDYAKRRMEGVYRLVSGNEFFGDAAVIKWNDPELLSIYCQKVGAYIVFKGGVKDSSLLFEGSWRFAFGTGTGLVRFVIPKDKGGTELLADSTSDFTVNLIGGFGEGNDKPDKSFVLSYARPFSESVIQNNYWIIGHRGGGRNSDYIGVSENTTAMISLAEQRGCNGIEIDIKLSKDGIPFIYHDPDVNLRLVQKSVIWGKIEDFTFPQLRNLITLKNGELIESLDEILEHVLNNTNLKFVWLDMKSDKNDMTKVIPIQQEYLQRAEAMGRDLKILIGLPTQDKVDQFLAVPDNQDLNNLCELAPDIVRQTDAEVWGPRWTLGLQTAEVESMHSEGREVITWTLDDPAWIRTYIQDGNFDGILTNYPMVVAYFYYVQ